MDSAPRRDVLRGSRPPAGAFGLARGAARSRPPRRRSRAAAPGSARRRSARADATHAAGSTAAGSKPPRPPPPARADRRVVVERPGHALRHGLEHAARAQRDHRPAGGERLDRGDPELLLGGHHQRLRACAAGRRPRRRASRPVSRTVGPASRRSRRHSGPSPTTTSGSPSALKARIATSIRLCAISSASTR